MASPALVPLLSFHSHSLDPFPPLLTPAGLSLPRGQITEIYGSASSGRTSFVLGALAQATQQEETCAYIDAHDTLDPGSAAAAKIALHRLLWVRCGGQAPTALKAADLVLQAGSFGVVVIDLGDVTPAMLRKIPMNYWYRFRRTVEGTRTLVMVIGVEPCVRQCARLSLEASRRDMEWNGTEGHARLLESLQFRFAPRKPVGAPPGALQARVREIA